ncbi:anti-anti-sigma factor [Anoxybacillus vitaminiphilus]|uniref:Anti-anti-sigma factor n=1 Tax=Paranoxybacillus vitaminiphilus TaxID=581036 RepID=A0A327YZY8_9BACL|nr:STAS domain-containing protein [Anoxybacillus vitaminiphilus]RAK23529.1 anti-anti-sigma factor [Anoxybacillus vitaminiphilus]
MHLQIKKIAEDRKLILKLSGVLDLSTAKSLIDQLNSVGNVKELVMDLENVEFIDSTGIGAIMEFIYHSQTYQYQFALANYNHFTEIFDTVGLFEILRALQGTVISDEF